MDIQLTDDYCPRCGTALYWQECTEINCDDGWIDAYEDDPLWYEPGELEMCQECEGRGYHNWCPNCNYTPYTNTTSLPPAVTCPHCGAIHAPEEPFDPIIHCDICGGWITQGEE